MNPAEAIPQTPLVEIKRDSKIVLPEESILAMDVADAINCLATEISAVQAALLTTRPIDPTVKDVLESFFKTDSPAAAALRLLADQLARARILAERRSEKPRGPRLVN